MTAGSGGAAAEFTAGDLAEVGTTSELADVLRRLRRREARRRRGAALSYRDLAAKAGCSHAVVGEYLTGRTLPPVERFDVLVRLLGADAAEQGALATARDRVEDRRRVVTPSPSRGVPRELPPAVSAFTGRAEQLAELDRLLAQDQVAPSAPAAVVCGTAGSGKTALAVSWAHRAAHRFPDGQLYVDLRGFDPGEPVSSHAALTSLLQGLGVAPEHIPSELDRCAATYRSALADRRMLVVLDNAGSAEQVRPLLPGSAPCAAVVTSRDDLAGLVARDGVRRLTIGPLAPPDAVALLRALIGDRVDAEAAAAARLAELCGRLPLALRVAAELAAGRPWLSLEELLADQGDGDPLGLLDHATDQRSALGAVLSWSHRHLPDDAAEVFGLLGLCPGRALDVYAVAALVGTENLRVARARLGRLSAGHLVQESRPGCWDMHDVLRAYAARRAEADLAPALRRAALARLVDQCVRTAADAAEALFPYERQVRPAAPVAGAQRAPVTEPQAARAWLDRERATLGWVSGLAAEYGLSAHAVALSRILRRYLDTNGHHQDALTVHGTALRAGAGDDRAEADAEAALARACWRLGDHVGAAGHARRARQRYRRLADRAGESRVLGDQAAVEQRLGRLAAAVGYLEESLAISRAAGDRSGEGAALANLAILGCQLGRTEQALGHAERAAAIGDELGNRHLAGAATGTIGLCLERLGRPEEALRLYQRALTVYRDTGDRAGETVELVNIGCAHRLAGRPGEALAALEDALDLAGRVGPETSVTEALNALGETLLLLDRPAEALVRHQQALVSARRTGDRLQEAYALDGVARSMAAGGIGGPPRDHWLAALAIYTELGVPEAAEVRARIDALPGTADPVPAG